MSSAPCFPRLFEVIQRYIKLHASSQAQASQSYIFYSLLTVRTETTGNRHISICQLYAKKEFSFYYFFGNRDRAGDINITGAKKEKKEFFLSGSALIVY